MTFAEAIQHLKAGHRIAREAWAKSEMWISASVPNYPRYEQVFQYDKKIPAPHYSAWVPTQDDLFVADWFVIYEGP